MWISIRDFTLLVGQHYPVSAVSVREWCEEGLIPKKFAKRRPGDTNKKWYISTLGVKYILENIMELDYEEVCEVQAKSPVNFNVLNVA